MSFDNLYLLLDGKIGTVVDGTDWDEDNDCIVIDGVQYDCGEEVDGIDEFLSGKNLDDLILFQDDGYRGVCCYSGYLKVGEKEYSLDIMNEYMVYELERR